MVQFSITMSSVFKRTFEHLRAVNVELLGPPPLVPAPNAPPLTATSQTTASSAAPPTLQPAHPAVAHLPTLNSAPSPASVSSSTIEFIKSFRGKTKMFHDGHTYTFHKERNNGYVVWRCDLNNKAARDKGSACYSTAVTTGTSTSSSLEYAKPHSHLPDPGRIGGEKIRESTKEAAKTTTEKPSRRIYCSLCIWFAAR